MLIEVREYRGEALDDVQTFMVAEDFAHACVAYLNTPVGEPLLGISPDFEWALLNARDRLPETESITLIAVPDHLRQSVVAVAVQDAGSKVEPALTLQSQLK